MFLSGTVPVLPDGTIPKGKVGLDVTTDRPSNTPVTLV